MADVGVPQAATPTLNDQVAHVVNRLTALAHQERRNELVEMLTSEAKRWSDPRTSLVVVGETKRGKSSLVNALLGRKDLLPVDTDVATNTYIVVQYGPEEGARVHLDNDRGVAEIPLEELGAWSSVAGNPANAKGVRAAEVFLDHELLATGLALVDTPGVGGLETAHGRVTLASLARADALLLVADASAPLSRPELAFLEQASQRVDEVLIAMTKVDQYRGWATILSDNRSLLQLHAPRFASASLMGVSSRLKAVADELAAQGEDHDSLDLLEESGLPALKRELLTRVVGKLKLLRLGNLLQVSLMSITALEAPLRATSAAAAGGSAAQEALDAQKARYEELRESSGRWHVFLGDQFNLLRDQLSSELSKALKQLVDTYEAELASWARDTEGLAEAVKLDLQAMDLDLGALLEREVDKILDSLAPMAGIEEIGVAARPPSIDQSFQWAHLAGTEVADPVARTKVLSTVLSSSGGMVMFGKMATMGGPLLTSLAGAGVVFGGAAMLLNLRAMRRQRELQGLRTELRATIEAARSEALPAYKQRTLALQRDIEDRLKSEVRDRMREVQRTMVQCQELARADTATREKSKATAERRLEELDQLRHQATSLLAEVSRRRAHSS